MNEIALIMKTCLFGIDKTVRSETLYVRFTKFIRVFLSFSTCETAPIDHQPGLNPEQRSHGPEGRGRGEANCYMMDSTVGVSERP